MVCNTVFSSSPQLVGVRIPNHPFIRELARACPGPLALTSANISCQASTLTVSVRLGLPLSDVAAAVCWRTRLSNWEPALAIKH